MTSRVWASYGAAVVGSFVALESVAVLRRIHHRPVAEAMTLTASLRRALGIDPERRYGKLTRVAFTAVMAWIIVHVTTKWA